jgi:hypothetical protein
LIGGAFSCADVTKTRTGEVRRSISARSGEDEQSLAPAGFFTLTVAEIPVCNYFVVANQPFNEPYGFMIWADEWHALKNLGLRSRSVQARFHGGSS